LLITFCVGRQESHANRAENHQLRHDKQVIMLTYLVLALSAVPSQWPFAFSQLIEERLKNVQLVGDEEKDAAFSGPGTWPVPKSRPQRVIIEQAQTLDLMDVR
jgi:hypothetical protein